MSIYSAGTATVCASKDLKSTAYQGVELEFVGDLRVFPIYCLSLGVRKKAQENVYCLQSEDRLPAFPDRDSSRYVDLGSSRGGIVIGYSRLFR